MVYVCNKPWEVSLLWNRRNCKRSVALESLGRPITNKVLTLEEMLEHCKRAILNNYFQKIELQSLQKTREQLQQRFQYATTIKGTRSFHNFKRMCMYQKLLQSVSILMKTVMCLTLTNLPAMKILQDRFIILNQYQQHQLDINEQTKTKTLLEFISFLKGQMKGFIYI